MTYKHLIRLALCVFTITATVPSYAIVQLLGDLTYEYNVSGGQVIRGNLQVHNPDAKAAQIQVIKQDADTRKQNRHHARSNSRWLTLSQERVYIAPRSTVNVSYRIRVPQRIAQGTHWSKILIEPVSQNNARQPRRAGAYTVGVKQKVRYAVNIMTHSGQGHAQLHFQRPSIIKKHGQRYFKFDVKNTGSQHSMPEVNLDIFTPQGRRVSSLVGSQRGLFPGYSKTFEIPLRGIRPSNYKALLVAIDKKTGRTFGTDINLTIKP